MKDARKTVAVRAAVTNFTPASGGPASNPCLNCGTNVQLYFCPECGQAAIDPDPTLREFLHESAEQFLHWDGKLFGTFRLLLTRPGLLTQEYLAGRRARYISPLRVYLLCSVLFFFVSALIPEQPVTTQKGNTVSTRVGPVVVQQREGESGRSAIDSLARSSDRVERLWGQLFGSAMDRPGELEAALKSAIPKTMFVLVPVFAALVGLVFRGRRMRYPQHLAFALHVHAFLFLALIVTEVVREQDPTALKVVAFIVSFGGIGTHFVQATRRVYGTTLGGAIVRDALIASAYLLCFLVAILLTFVLVVLLKF